MGLFRNKARVPKFKQKEIRLRDVWVAARLASSHSAGAHSMLNTLIHTGVEHAAQLEALRTDVSAILKHVTPETGDGA